MENIKNIILTVAARFLTQVYDRKWHDNYDKSPFYQDISKEELKMLSDYIVEKYHDEYWDYWDEDYPGREKNMFSIESSAVMNILSKELRKIANEN